MASPASAVLGAHRPGQWEAVARRSRSTDECAAGQPPLFSRGEATLAWSYSDLVRRGVTMQLRVVAPAFAMRVLPEDRPVVA